MERQGLLRNSFLVLLVMVSCTAAPDQVRQDDPHIHKEKGVFLYDGIPYTGTLLEYNGEGELVSEFALTDGIRNGVSRFYRSGGKLEREAEYRNGIYHGFVKVYYENGDLYSWFNYSDGHEAGRQQVWKSDGRIKANYEVINGRKYGLTGVKNCVNVLEENDHGF